VISLTLKASSASIRYTMRALVSSRRQKTTKQSVQLHVASDFSSFLARIPVFARLQDLLTEHPARDMNLNDDLALCAEKPRANDGGPERKAKKLSLDDIQNILSKHCTH
jgi:hypothetical protein